MELKWRIRKSTGASIIGSNRTFMELKFETVKAIMYDAESSNRTFMELKFGLDYLLCSNRTVLIVPLWN